jgi:hypothetical protein
VRELWARLPGETPTRVAVVGFLAGLLAAVVLAFVLPAFEAPAIDPPSDGIGIEDDVVEPDGVRSSPTFAPSEVATPPDIPDEDGALQ